MALKNSKVETIERTFVQTILELITDPNIVFILFSIGMLGITLELYNPGAILPGVVGTISLILALYSFQTLPINYAGVVLILLAAIMFIAEIKVVSHGLLTVGGLISLFFGGIMLVDTVDPNLQVSMTVIITVVAFIGLLLAIVLYLLIKDRLIKPFIGNEGMAGKIAEGRINGMVYVDGALWRAECDLEITEGDKFEIIAVDNLLLKVKKL
jgi:membrane-bound serine protease (ClpP class)